MNMRYAAIIGCSLLLMTGFNASAADEASKVTIGAIRMDPMSPATLHSMQSVSVGIHYKSPVPIKIQAALYRSGQIVIGLVMQTKLIYPAGEGDALIGVSPTLGRAADVDTLEISVDSADTGEELKTINVPVTFAWDTQHAPSRPRAGWVETLIEKLQPPKQ